MDSQREERPDGGAQGPAPRSSYPPGTLRVGTVAGTDVLVRASWLVVAVLIAVVLAPQVDRVQPGLGALKYVAGVAFAVLLYLSVLLHEISHAVVARRYGIQVRSISLHFLGGATEIEGEPRSAKEEFTIAVVGPLTSIAVGLVALALLLVTPDGLIRLAVQGLASANLVVGVLNLVPGLPLDGGRLLRAGVWRATGDVHAGTLAAGWGGRVLAVVVLAYPVLARIGWGIQPDVADYVVATVMAAFLWGGAGAAMTSARIRRRLPGLQARPLARRAVTVPDSLSVAEAVRRAQEAGAGGIVVRRSDDRVSGVVNEAALLAIPEERRAWVPVSSVARTVEDGLLLQADLVGEDLVAAMTRFPAAEYVLLERDGSLYGVLTTQDVDRAFAAGAPS